MGGPNHPLRRSPTRSVSSSPRLSRGAPAGARGGNPSRRVEPPSSPFLPSPSPVARLRAKPPQRRRRRASLLPPLGGVRRGPWPSGGGATLSTGRGGAAAGAAGLAVVLGWWCERLSAAASRTVAGPDGSGDGGSLLPSSLAPSPSTPAPIRPTGRQIRPLRWLAGPSVAHGGLVHGRSGISVRKLVFVLTPQWGLTSSGLVGWSRWYFLALPWQTISSLTTYSTAEIVPMSVFSSQLQGEERLEHKHNLRVHSSAHVNVLRVTKERLEKILERYDKFLLSERNVIEEYAESEGRIMYDHIKLGSRIEALQKSQRNLKGEQLDSLTLCELQQLEQQIINALRNIRLRKNHEITNLIVELQNKERLLMEQNSILQKEKVEVLQAYAYKNCSDPYRKAAIESTLPDLNTCEGSESTEEGQ